MEDSVFTKIIKRELPAEILYEDEETIVILDRFPAVTGQTLVIPKQQEPYLFTLAEERYARLLALTRRIVLALDQSLSPLRTCMVVEGFEVPHVHIRLYPVTEPTLPLAAGPMKTDEELRAVGETIRAALR